VLIFRGDVIVEVNGKEVRSVRDVFNAIGLEVGKELHLKVKRGESEFTTTVVTAPEYARRR